jgi:hypothetical protein
MGQTMTTDTRRDIRNAVYLAMEYWPNAHLGTNTPRDDMRSAFKMLRSWTDHESIQCAIGQLERSAYSHADM